MKKTRIITFLLTLIMIFNIMAFSAYAAEGVLTAPQYFSELYPNVGSKTPVRPVHEYLYRQNPPSFLWPAIDGASSYELIIYSDEALTKVYRRVDNIKDNYHLFTEPFETGKYYWWTYRYKNNGNTSPWAVARRFKVATDAKTTIFPTADDLISKTSGKHPILYFTEDTLPDYKKSIYENEYNYEYFRNVLIPKADSDIASGIIKEPIYIPDESEWSYYYRNTQYNILNVAMRSAFIYHITGNSEYGDFAVDSLLEYLSWDWEDENSAASFEFDDVAHMRALGLTAIAYDWCYDIMDSDEIEFASNALFEKATDTYGYVSNILEASPYGSHEWSCFQSYGLIFATLLGTIDQADIYFNDFCEILFSNYTPYSIEDGGFSKGINYWGDSFDADYQFMEAMSLSGVFDFYDIPYMDNHWLWAIYMYATPTTNRNSWGDSGGSEPYTDKLINGASRFAYLADNPELLWWKNKFGTLYDYGQYDAPLLIGTDVAKVKAPIELPKDWHFKDIGMTAMHSDLINEPRISATFRSGLYGSYNHSQADINSFMIESNGKSLAWKNGYYGYYGSEHHIKFARASHAHNTITYDNGKGQPSTTFDFDADGVTTMFLSNSDMSVAVGDAKEAYKGGLEKYDRTFIYVRPDMYIVVDNLKASDANISANGGSTFEWWLNSIGTIDLHEDNRGAVITNDGEALDARIHYPVKTSAFYSNLFAGPDGVEVLPYNVSNWTRQGRVWFQTQKVPETKIIATMGVRGTEENPDYANITSYQDYMKISFSDGSLAYVSTLTDETQLISADNFRFNGTAVVVNDDHIMFIGGTKLYIDGSLVIDADRPVAVTMGEDELGVSSGDDYNITLYLNDYMPDVASVRFRNDEEPVEIGMGIETKFNSKNDTLTIHADKGHYSLLLNDKLLPGDRVDGEWNYTLTINGNTENRTTDYLYYCDADYNIGGIAMMDNTSLKENVEYHISDITGDITYNGKPLKEGDIIFYSPEHELVISKDGCSLSLDSYENTAVAFEDITTSYVEFTKDDADGTVLARVRVTNKGEEPISARLILTAFDSEDKFLTMTESKSLIVDSKGETHFEASLTNPPQNAENYKAFLWRPGSVIPFAQLADSSAEAKLKGIEIDGVAIEGFDPSVTEYSYQIPSDDNVLPVVKGIPWDNAIYTTTAYKIANGGKSAVATISYQNLYAGEDAKTYMVNITLSPDNTGKICDHFSDFTTYFNGITADTYGGKVYENGDETTDASSKYPTTLTADFRWAMNSNYRISPFDGVRDQFEWQGNAGYMRYYSDLDRITGLENSLYMRQSCLINVGTANNAGVTPAEIQKRAFSESAFFGSKIYNYSTYSPKNTSTQLEMYDCTGLGDKLWASFKVNKDCDVIIVSRSKVPASFLENPQYGWKKVSNAGKPAIEMIRMQSSGQQAIPMISVQPTYYIQSFEAGDTVELYNANNGLSDKSTDESTPSYHVFVRVK